MQEQLQEIDEKTSCHEDRVFFHSFAAQERLETLAKGRVEKEAQPARGGPRRQLTKSKNFSKFFKVFQSFSKFFKVFQLESSNEL